jgi:hypothetical protein
MGNILYFNNVYLMHIIIYVLVLCLYQKRIRASISMHVIGTLLEEAGHSWIGESVRDFCAHGEVWHGLRWNW